MILVYDSHAYICVLSVKLLLNLGCLFLLSLRCDSILSLDSTSLPTSPCNVLPPQLHVGRCLTSSPLSEVFLSCEGDGHVLVLLPRLILVLDPRLVLVLIPRLVLGGNLVSCLLQGLSPGREGQEEKGSKESKGPHG